MEEDGLGSPLLLSAAPKTAAPTPALLRALIGLWYNGNAVISLAALVCSTIALFIKQLHGEVPAMEITLASSCVSWVLTTAWCLMAGEGPRSLFSQRVGLLALRGFLGAVTSCLYYQSIQMLHMNEAVTIFFTNPAMAVLLDWAVSGKTVNAGTLAGVALSISGVALVGCPDCDFGPAFSGGGGGGAAGPWWQLSPRGIGVLLGLTAAFANAAGYLAVHAIGATVPFCNLMWWYHTCVTLGSLGGLTLLPVGQRLVVPSPGQTGWILAVAAAHFVGQLLLNRGFNLDDASHGAALFSQQVLYSHVWAVTIMHAPLQPCALLGSGAILAGVVLVTESSGMSHSRRELEVERTLSTLERRMSLPPTSVAARLGFKRMGSMPARIGERYASAAGGGGSDEPYASRRRRILMLAGVLPPSEENGHGDDGAGAQRPSRPHRQLSAPAGPYLWGGANPAPQLWFH